MRLATCGGMASEMQLGKDGPLTIEELRAVLEGHGHV
jgi:hypothetical protein